MGSSHRLNRASRAWWRARSGLKSALGLLWADIDVLEVLNVDLLDGVLVHGTENEREVPDAHPDLDAAGVVGAVVG
jgi:hypothetical protein